VHIVIGYIVIGYDPESSVAMAQADIFAILGNKIVKNLKIFVEVGRLPQKPGGPLPTLSDLISGS